MTNDKAMALAAFLQCDLDDVSGSVYDDCELDGPGGTYLVLTESEADERTEAYIRDSVWAFNASFLRGYGSFSLLDTDDIDRLRGDKCESINDAFISMIDSDWDDFVADAIGADGRGHFLAGYDGNEDEQDGFLIYRTN